jgi:hypothetical protein
MLRWFRINKAVFTDPYILGQYCSFKVFLKIRRFVGCVVLPYLNLDKTLHYTVSGIVLAIPTHQQYIVVQTIDNRSKKSKSISIPTM